MTKTDKTTGNETSYSKLRQIDWEIYGHDERAINRHSVRTYQDESGNLYELSRTLDGMPPFFEAHGPFSEDYVGVTPRLKVNGEDYWGGDWTWKRAAEAFVNAINERTGKVHKICE
jgi:hypothetical protein